MIVSWAVGFRTITVVVTVVAFIIISGAERWISVAGAILVVAGTVIVISGTSHRRGAVAGTGRRIVSSWTGR